MRFVVLIGRIIGLCVEAFGYGVILLIWLFLPVLSFVFIVQGLLRLMTQA